MIIYNNNYKYLCYTNLLLIISIEYFIFNTIYLNKIPNIEFLLACLLIVTIFFSQLFWNNPIQNSTIHKIDAFIAKIVICLFIVYTLIYKFKIGFVIVLLAVTISFYFSNYYSKKEWCCNKHIFCHGLLHIFCFIATFYTFSPIL